MRTLEWKPMWDVEQRFVSWNYTLKVRPWLYETCTGISSDIQVALLSLVRLLTPSCFQEWLWRRPVQSMSIFMNLYTTFFNVFFVIYQIIAIPLEKSLHCIPNLRIFSTEGIKITWNISKILVLSNIFVKWGKKPILMSKMSHQVHVICMKIPELMCPYSVPQGYQISFVKQIYKWKMI